MELFNAVSLKCSKLVTLRYSTSFSLGIKALAKRFHDPVFAIYGFVRFADEIVDTIKREDSSELLEEFKRDTYLAIDRGISLNPILQSFQLVVNKYEIERNLIETFLDSMEMDITVSSHDQDSYEKYILGSAEVVGLMCLRVFVEGNGGLYDQLRAPAMRLGSAFQKVNFLRDIKDDYSSLGRVYFPRLKIEGFGEREKELIEQDIKKDLEDGYQGILRLPKGTRLGVYMAYVYYYALFRRISDCSPATILNQRVRIPNIRKYSLFLSSYLRHSLNRI